MRHKLKTFSKFILNTNGASLMEFAVVTALMAVLAATAAPKFSNISEKSKMQKSKNEMEKIGKQALNFFQDMAVKEGRGRFPGQTKFDQKVGGHSSLGEIEEDLFGNQTSVATFQRFDSQDGSDWVSVFGFDTYYGPDKNKISLNSGYSEAKLVWSNLFGDEILNSPFQDGHYVYQVLPGSGSGSQSNAPTIFIADLENPSQINLVIQP
tara:strand:+ start:787 stop:1413 length:627 start_codon:yes stop_codon:yes gene_type:complete